MRLEDGEGSGILAGVDNENRLKVVSISKTAERHVNEHEGEVWSISFDTVTAAGANDYFLYLKNTSDVMYAIPTIRISSSVATRIDYDRVSGVPTYATGGECTVTNRNTSSSKTPSITTRYDTDITDLTYEGMIFFEQCSIADTRYKLDIGSDILLGPGQAIAFKRVEATGAVTGVITLTGLD